MQIVYTKESVSDNFTKSIFLAGPTPRSQDVPSWRSKAISLLGEAGFEGAVFVPEPRDGKWSGEYTNQIEWEEKYLNMADCILFWIPRNLETMPAFTTNIEWGVWQNSGKVVLGAPPEAPKMRYQRYYAQKLDIPTAGTLEGTVREALELLKRLK